MAFSSVFLVDRLSVHNERFIVAISERRAQELYLNKDDYVKIIGGNLKKAICNVEINDYIDEKKALINNVVRHNIGVYLNDAITIEHCPNINSGSRVWIGLMDCSAARGLTEDICKELLKQHFEKSPFPIYEGNKFIARGGMRAVEFIVVKTEPAPYCIINSKTAISFKSTVEKYKVGEKTLSDVSYDDIGGQMYAIESLREIEFPLKFPNLFKELKAVSPRIMLYGPNGVGKVLIAKALANETGANFVYYDGNNIKKFSTSEVALYVLQKRFGEAKKLSPSVLCIDGLDVIAPKKMKKDDKVLLKGLVESIKQLDKQFVVILIAITSQLREVNGGVTQLFVNSRMDKQIQVELPDFSGRLEILRLHTRNMKLSKNFELHDLAFKTEHFTAAAIADLCKKVAFAHKDDEEFLLTSDEEMDDIRSFFSKTISNVEFQLCMKNVTHLGY